MANLTPHTGKPSFGWNPYLRFAAASGQERDPPQVGTHPRTATAFHRQTLCFVFKNKKFRMESVLAVSRWLPVLRWHFRCLTCVPHNGNARCPVIQWGPGRSETSPKPRPTPEFQLTQIGKAYDSCGKTRFRVESACAISRRVQV